MTATKHAAGFHLNFDSAARHVAQGHVGQLTYTFEHFFHPYVGDLITQLNRTSVEGMLEPHFLHQLRDDKFFRADYHPAESQALHVHGAPKEIDVTPGGAYASYNWELLFHIPIAIAVHLSKTQRFAEAQKWFHYVFDPTSSEHGPAAQRCWKFLAFRGEQVLDIDHLLVLLSTPDKELKPDQVKRKEWVHRSYEAILAAPFQPHVVARARPAAYQYYVVMKYLDNLIAWGDSLFAQYTIETINEAMVSYVLAANLLGPRPQQVPSRGTIAPKNFAQMKKAGLDAMGNALVELEGQFPFNSTLPASHQSASAAHNGLLFGVGSSLYFCVPKNEKLLGYWDTVADRLFKIRNCMDISGVVRPLPLFDPPIDPGMLVKAAAAGIDIGSILSGMNQPIGPLRSLAQIQKAMELCGEVKALGNALLSAWEKGDGEQMALTRQGHEIALQQMTQNVRLVQWKQAQEATHSLRYSRTNTLERYKYYLDEAAARQLAG